MSAPPKQSPRHEDPAFARWRLRALRAAGFDEELAQRVAAAPSFDLHAVLGLVDRGCPPHLAVRIAAPLHWEDP